MGRADHAGLGIGEQHRRAIGGEDSEQQPGPVGDHRVGVRPLVLRPRLLDIDGVGRMDLVHGRQLGAGQHRGDRAAAVLGDRLRGRRRCRSRR